MLLSNEDLPLQHIHNQNLRYRQDSQCNPTKRVNQSKTPELLRFVRSHNQLGFTTLKISCVTAEEQRPQ